MEPESDGTFMKKTMPFNKLKPEHIVSGVLAWPDEVKVDRRFLCLYPITNVYYEAIVQKISEEGKLKTGLKVTYKFINLTYL